MATPILNVSTETLQSCLERAEQLSIAAEGLLNYASAPASRDALLAILPELSASIESAVAKLRELELGGHCSLPQAGGNVRRVL